MTAFRLRPNNRSRCSKVDPIAVSVRTATFRVHFCNRNQRLTGLQLESEIVLSKEILLSGLLGGLGLFLSTSGHWLTALTAQEITRTVLLASLETAVIWAVTGLVIARRIKPR